MPPTPTPTRTDRTGTQAILQLRAMARAVASWRASQVSRAWRRWRGVATALRVATMVGVRWRSRNAWRALHSWREWAGADRTAERLLTSAGVRWRTSGCAKALSHWAGLAELRHRLWTAGARMRSRELWRALHCWQEQAAAYSMAEQLLTSAGLRWRASGRGGAFAHWLGLARARSAAWSGALRATRSWRAQGLSAAWRRWRWQAEAREATRRALFSVVQQWCRHAQAVAWRTWRGASEARRRLRRLTSRLEPHRKGVARAWAAWAEVVLLRVEVLARLREAAIMLKPKGRALRVWQQNVSEASSVSEARLLLAVRRWRHSFKRRAWVTLCEGVRERERLLQACDATARRWLQHLTAAAVLTWRENGAVWHRVLLGLGRRSARDEQRRGMLTWRAFTAARGQALGIVRAVIARWRQRRLVEP